MAGTRPMSAEHYCLDKATPPGSNLYYCLLYQAEHHKRGLRALFALAYELQQIIAKNTDAGVTRIKLQWWQHEMEKVCHHESQHPIGMELQEALKQEKLDKPLLFQSIHAIERHVQATRPNDYPAWISQCGEYHGSIWKNAAMLCACEDPDSLKISGSIGHILAALDVLQDLPRYLHRGLCPLPCHEMQQHGVTMAMLQRGAQAKPIRNFFAYLITNLSDRLLALQAEIPACDRQKLLFARVATRLALALCDEIRRDHYRLLENRIALTPLRKLWLAWRTK